ncbi:hypothetical protein C8J57DRAFT_1235497 [Mycena rebaudengoi]|nr:hypothetical protein C8J57DRAFT_1235497 [Mycena rebaudengoi]
MPTILMSDSECFRLHGTSPNNEFRPVAHYLAHCHFGVARKINSLSRQNIAENWPKISDITLGSKARDLLRSTGRPAVKSAKVAQYPVTNTQVDDSDFDSQEDNEDPVKIDVDGGNRVHESTTASEESGPPSLRDAMPVSRTFRFFMNVQGMLFLFLALSWLYAQLW